MTVLLIMVFSNNWITKQPNKTLVILTNQFQSNEIIFMTKLTYYNMSMLSIIFMMMLFFSLCSTISLITIHEGPMRKMN